MRSSRTRLRADALRRASPRLRARSARLLDHGYRLFLGLDHLASDDALPDLLLAGERVHQVEHQVLDDHPEPAGANLATQRRLRNRMQRVVGEAKLDVLVFEQPL